MLPIWRIHRSIGMGGDQLVPALAGDEWEAEHGDDVRATEKERYSELIEEVEPLPGARELIQRLKDEGHAVVLASSAKEEEVDHYLDLLDARELADAWTMSDDVEITKPAPDLVKAALDKVDGSSGVMLGDSTFDCEAAARADVPTVAVLTGGFSARGADGGRSGGGLRVARGAPRSTRRHAVWPRGRRVVRRNGTRPRSLRRHRGIRPDARGGAARGGGGRRREAPGTPATTAEDSAGVPDDPGSGQRESRTTPG